MLSARKKQIFIREIRKKLISSVSNPLKFWKLIKQARARKQSHDKIKYSEWLEHFKGLLFDSNRVSVVLYNKIFDLGDFQEQWGGSIICPIHKQGPFDDSNNFSGIFYVDFVKAFDTIDHSKLLTCLADRSVVGKLLTILKSMNCKLHSCVQSNAHFTDFSHVS